MIWISIYAVLHRGKKVPISVPFWGHQLLDTHLQIQNTHTHTHIHTHTYTQANALTHTHTGKHAHTRWASHSDEPVFSDLEEEEEGLIWWELETTSDWWWLDDEVSLFVYVLRAIANNDADGDTLSQQQWQQKVLEHVPTKRENFSLRQQCFNTEPVALSSHTADSSSKAIWTSYVRVPAI